MIFLGLGASLLILKTNNGLEIETGEYLPSSSDDKGNLGLGLNVEVAGGFSVTLGLDGSGISGGVLVLVLLGFGGEVFAGLDTLGLGFGTSLDGGVVEDLVAGLLLEDVFGDGSCPKQNHAVNVVLC